MLIDRAVQLAMVVVIMLWGALTDAAPRRGGTFKMCGRTLSHFMSHVCRVHNSPPSSWDVPTGTYHFFTVIIHFRDVIYEFGV